MNRHSFLFTLICLFAVMQVSYGQFNKNVVIAHRGAWKAQDIPQNSLASLNQAVEIGCHGSEFDVHLTKDEVLVVNHDRDYFGLDIESSTYQELLAKKLPNGESIPTLESYLKEGMKQKKTRLILEIKPSTAKKERALKTAELCVSTVKKLKAQKWVDYITFDYEAGKLVGKLDPKAEVAYLNGDVAPAQAKKDGYTGLDYHFKVYKANPTWIKEAQDLGLSVNCWTVNDEADMAELLNQKVDFITTDEPEKLFEVIQAHE
ncbi:glycerophosphodiester phosphodiesterase [Olivibacter sp. SDN3]|uniref:glycerophosphodiester phosphodiesterase n=1 Tax=Olivibacter sp. SDN3 TaxID=2764720 RepID=UPI0016513B0E|nr:glycerophosphodiester phosphodiesterase family protein [Olivibacter sp. SDN3]QNL49193.1 glycerophosphodiester phosphodiesterase [Olivibacter sp. SDN3]